MEETIWFVYISSAVMNKKGLAILMRTKMRLLSPTFASVSFTQIVFPSFLPDFINLSLFLVLNWKQSKSKLNKMQTSPLEGDKVSSHDASLLPERFLIQSTILLHFYMICSLISRLQFHFILIWSLLVKYSFLMLGSTIFNMMMVVSPWRCRLLIWGYIAPLFENNSSF